MSTTSRQRVIQTLNHQPVDRAPRDLWTLPGVDKCQGEEIAELLRRYPLDIEKADYKYPAGRRTQGKPYEVGQHTDAWGCVWHVAEPGVTGEVKGHPLAEAAARGSYQPPWELLEPAKMERSTAPAPPAAASCWPGPRPVPSSGCNSCGAPRPVCRPGRGPASSLPAGHAPRFLLPRAHDVGHQRRGRRGVHGRLGVADVAADRARNVAELFKPLYRDYCEILHAQASTSSSTATATSPRSSKT